MTLGNFSSDARVRQAIGSVKGLLRKCVENRFIYSQTDIERMDWREVGNRLVFCFHDAQLVDYVCIKRAASFAQPAGRNALERYEAVFTDLLRFFSCKMMVLFLEFVRRDDEFGASSKMLVRSFENSFLRFHRQSSLKEVVALYRKRGRAKAVVFTFSKKTSYKVPNFEEMSSKLLESRGSTALEKGLERVHKRGLEGLLVSFEDSDQFAHLAHLQKFVDDFAQRRAQAEGERPWQVLFVVHQTGSAAARSKVFLPSEAVGEGAQRGWATHYLDNLAGSFYKWAHQEQRHLPEPLQEAAARHPRNPLFVLLLGSDSGVAVDQEPRQPGRQVHGRALRRRPEALRAAVRAALRGRRRQDHAQTGDGCGRGRL